MNPLARKNDIFTENLPEEVILYDKTNNQAHCLKKTAAAVWENCDGTRSVEDLAQIVEQKLGTPIDRDVVLLALEELEKAGLLESGVDVIPNAALASRREAVGKIALAGTALVVTMVAAAPSAHASQGPKKTPSPPPPPPPHP